MKKDTLILALGVVVVVLPFLGFPGSFETALSVLAGFGIIVATLLLRREIANKPFSLKKHFEQRADSFVQNGDPAESNLESGASRDRAEE